MTPYAEHLEAFRCKLLTESLRAAGSISQAARILGLQRTYLSKLLKTRKIMLDIPGYPSHTFKATPTGPCQTCGMPRPDESHAEPIPHLDATA